ncbi:hypothetical protein Pelo_3977 [Pelomyxa schiedti]|nr:hypothetical protein Pelo_3977 [Pelomyxa schiedti]
MSCAEAMFPIVAKVCGVVLAAKNAGKSLRVYRSTYFALECAATAGGGDSDRGRCVTWILKHRKSRNVGKECAAVFVGLCAGGHLKTARSFVDKPIGAAAAKSVSVKHARMWTKDCGLLSVPEDDVSWTWGSLAMTKACRSGHLEVAKWIVKRFYLQDWELCEPFLAAVKGGHIRVTKWIATLETSLDLKFIASSPNLFPVYRNAAVGGLAMIKWCFGMLHGNFEASTLKKFLVSKRTAEEHIEGCEWFSQQLPGMILHDVNTRSRKPLMWLLQNGLVSPADAMSQAFYTLCDAKLAEWLADNLGIPLPSLECMRMVVQNMKDSVSVVKLMLKRFNNLPPRVIEESFEYALRADNTAVADFLEALYSTPKSDIVHSLRLSECCRPPARFREGVDALKWYFQRIPPEFVEEQEVINTVRGYLKVMPQPKISAGLFLLKKFRLSRAGMREKNREKMWKAVLHAIPKADLSSAKEMASIGQFSQAEIAKGLLAVCSGYFLASDFMVSSKVFRWLIDSYSLTAEQVTAGCNVILGALITRSKTQCARWLIKKFGVTQDQVLNMSDFLSWHTVSLPTWKMLLKQFPGITVQVIRETKNFMRVVVSSPYHFMHACNRLGMRSQDLWDFCEEEKIWHWWSEYWNKPEKTANKL